MIIVIIFNLIYCKCICERWGAYFELKWNPEGQCWSGHGDDLPSQDAESVSTASPVHSTVDAPVVTGHILLRDRELAVDEVLPHCKLHSVHSDHSDHAEAVKFRNILPQYTATSVIVNYILHFVYEFF